MTTPLTPAEQTLQRDSQWAYYAQWLDLDRKERALRGIPQTQEQIAAQFGLQARTLRKWQDQPAFKALQKKYAGPRNTLRTSRPILDQDTSHLVPVTSDFPGDQGEVEDEVLASLQGDDRLREIWRRNAEEDPRAATFWWNAWGKAEAAARERAATVTYDETELDALIVEGCVAVGADTVVKWLASQGWKVERL